MPVLTYPEVKAIEDRLAEAMGLVNAATAELVGIIAEALERRAWEGEGIRSPEHWVAWRAGVSSRRATELVALARRLPELAHCHALFTSGSLTEDQAAVIGRYTTADHDHQVAQLAPALTVAQLRRVLPSLPRQPEPAEPEAEPPSAGDHHGRREVRFGNHDDGRWWCRMVLPPEEGAVLQAGLEAARQDCFDDGHEREVGWADAALRLAQVTLDAYASCAAGHRRTPTDRWSVVVHVRPPEEPGGEVRGELHLGPPLPAAILRYLLCDAPLRWVLDREGNSVRLGRRTRTVPRWLHTLIEDRDRTCRVPGCGQRRWLHVHHIVAWEDGGATDPENLVALCPFHHREHHLGRLRISGDPSSTDGLVFTTADGRIPAGPRARPPGPDTRRPPHQFQAPFGERLQTRWLHWN